MAQVDLDLLRVVIMGSLGNKFSADFLILDTCKSIITFTVMRTIHGHAQIFFSHQNSSLHVVILTCTNVYTYIQLPLISRHQLIPFGDGLLSPSVILYMTIFLTLSPYNLSYLALLSTQDCMYFENSWLHSVTLMPPLNTISCL